MDVDAVVLTRASSKKVAAAAEGMNKRLMILVTTSKFKMAVEIGVFRPIREALYFFSHF